MAASLVSRKRRELSDKGRARKRMLPSPPPGAGHLILRDLGTRPPWLLSAKAAGVADMVWSL
jgi:hypothetical protein